MDRNQCIKLITLYSEHDYLWDPSDPNYINRELREKAWRNISEELGLSVGALKKKLESLLGSYRREKSREKRGTVSGHKAYKSRWYAYKHFNFLPRSNVTRAVLDMEGQDDPRLPSLDQNATATETSAKKMTYITPSSDPQHARLLRPKRPRTTSTGEGASEDNMTEVVRLLRQYVHSSTPKDHYTTFGNYIANELRKYDQFTLAHVKNAICGIIFEADTGKFTHFPSAIKENEHGNSILPDNSSNSSPAASPEHMFHVEMHPTEHSQGTPQPSTSKCVVKTEMEDTTETGGE